MRNSIKYLFKGMLSFIPGMRKLFPTRSTGGTNSAYYCYEVWLKLLTLSWAHGMERIPGTVAELGPGDSIGIGLAAMLSGTNHYYALDVVKFADRERNLKIFDELVELFRKRAGGRPNGWPDYKPYVDENLFPSHILTDDVLGRSLSEERIAAIRKAIDGQGEAEGGISIGYMVPWTDNGTVRKDSVDFIYSHCVLEYIDDLDETYRTLYAWLKPGGVMAHQIIFTAHDITREWNGHRAYPEFLWKLVAGRKPYLCINRQPLSVHLNFIEQSGFKLVCNVQKHRPGEGLPRSRHANRWRGISDEDLTCSGVFVVAKK